MQRARHDQALNRKIACEILVAVGQHAEVARECLSELCRDKKMEVRHWTLAYLSMDLPRDFVLDRLRDALSDRSATVRISASETITGQKIYELQNNLEAAAQVEKNDKAKRALSMNLGLLKDGYYVL